MFLIKSKMHRTMDARKMRFLNSERYTVNGNPVSEERYNDTMRDINRNNEICPPGYHWVRTYRRKSKNHYGKSEETVMGHCVRDPYR